MTDPIREFLPYVRNTAHRFGASLPTQDREEMEGYLRLHLWRGWLAWRPDGGCSRRAWLIGCLRCAAREWMRSERPGTVSRRTYAVMQDPASLARMPHRFRQWHLDAVALSAPLSLDDVIAGEDSEHPLHGRDGSRCAEAAPSAEHVVASLDERRAVRQLIDALPDHEREAVRLCYLADLTQKEAAGRLGVSPSAVRDLLRSARRRLRAAMEATP